jgi:ubiquitin-conjugating enzyme E2 J1
MSKSPSLRRIQADIRELSLSPSPNYTASPLEHDMFEWHFTIRGAPDTDFSGGVYHGRILLPPEYPFKPPNIVFMTPSGRFETNTKVCLSFSAFHPELWQPAWGIRLILEALISFLPTPADGAIGALDWTKEERVKLAKESVKFRCPVCCAPGGTCVDLLPDVEEKEVGKKTQFHEEIEKLKMLQFQNHASSVGEEEENADKAEGNNEAQKSSETAEETKVSCDKPDTTAEQTEATKNEVTKQIDTIDSELDATQTEITNMPVSTPENVPEAAPAPQQANTQPPVAPPPAAAATPNNQAAHPGSIDQAPIVSDNVLNGMIAVLAVVVFVLLRQAQELVDELRSLD